MKKNLIMVFAEAAVAVLLICAAIFMPFGKMLELSAANVSDVRLVCYLLAYIIPGANVFRRIQYDMREKNWKAINIYITIVSLVIFVEVNEITAVILIVLARIFNVWNDEKVNKAIK